MAIATSHFRLRRLSTSQTETPIAAANATTSSTCSQ